MAPLHEAMFYEKRAGGGVLCTLCPHDCHIGNGRRGACGVRFHDAGKLYTLVYDRIVSREIDPVEKKPLFNFFPGSRAYSITHLGSLDRGEAARHGQLSLAGSPGAGLPEPPGEVRHHRPSREHGVSTERACGTAYSRLNSVYCGH
jgi:hypothetical protein